MCIVGSNYSTSARGKLINRASLIQFLIDFWLKVPTHEHLMEIEGLDKISCR